MKAVFEGSPHGQNTARAEVSNKARVVVEVARLGGGRGGKLSVILRMAGLISLSLCFLRFQLLQAATEPNHRVNVSHTCSLLRSTTTKRAR